MRILVTSCLIIATSSAAWAEGAAVQIGDHPKFGRIVFSLQTDAPAIVRQRGARVEVTALGQAEIALPDFVPRNVLSISGGRGSAQLAILSGAQVKSQQSGRTLIIDVLDPAARSRDLSLTTGSRPNPGKPSVKRASDHEPPRPLVKQEQAAGHDLPRSELPAVDPAVVPPPPELAPEPAVVNAVETTAVLAEPAAPSPLAIRGFTMLAGPNVGAAAFRRGEEGIVIFDDAVTLAQATESERTITPAIKPIQNGVLLSVPLASDETLALTQSQDSWTVRIAASTGSPAAATAIPTGIQFQVAKPGRTMVVSDPVSGQTLLIGTTRQADGDHAAVTLGRSAPGYVLLPTWLGVALETSSDRIDLKVSLVGYTLETADPTAANATASPRPDNQLGIPVASGPVLLQQMNAQIASAAAAAPRSRGSSRVAAARTMLALGMSAEAQALLELAAKEDPAVARDPSAAALTGVAAVLAGRPADAGGLDNPALPSNGDIALWRGLRDADAGKSAPVLARAWPLLAAYPEQIQQRIKPQVLEAAAELGADVPASELGGPSLALARALKLSHDGQVEPALAEFSAVVNSRDDRDSVRAAVAAAELRLRTGLSSPAETAEQLDRQTIRWRGDQRELELRLRVAALRIEAGQWRSALDGMRQTEALFPDAKVKVAARRADLFRSLLSDPAPKIAPLEFVSIAGDFAASLPDGADGQRLAGLLAEKLASLDLPARAVPVLEKLFANAQSPLAKVEVALRLAQMQIDAGDAGTAATMLASLDTTGASADRQDQLTVLSARAKAAQGDFAGAATTLLTVSSAEADAMRATFYAKAGDWQRSFETLDGMVTASVPETGELADNQQDLILRDATAAAQAGDTGALRRLKRFEPRISAPRVDLFRILTANAVKGPEDLPRAARELAMLRTLPDRLKDLKSP